MTQHQWRTVSGKNPSRYKQGLQVANRPITARHPVEQVSWTRCEQTLRARGLLLPTGAQWEFAARAGTRTPWWSGEKRTIQGAANLFDAFLKNNGGPPNRPYETWLDDGHAIHAPVGRFRPNRFGLYDVAGNVWEWCRDRWEPYSQPARPGDGLRKPGKVATTKQHRVYRGGGWFSPVEQARSAYRMGSTPEFTDWGLGVRPARQLD